MPRYKFETFLDIRKDVPDKIEGVFTIRIENLEINADLDFVIWIKQKEIQYELKRKGRNLSSFRFRKYKKGAEIIEILFKKTAYSYKSLSLNSSESERDCLPPSITGSILNEIIGVLS